MGEKIKDIGVFHIGGKEVKIELNQGYSPEYSKYDIHIQSDSAQYCITNREFMNLASIMITARRKMDKMKK